MNLSQSGLFSKTCRALQNGEKKLKKRSKILGITSPILYWMQEILEYHKPVNAGLQYVFEEEVALIHNYYGGFGETKVRVFTEYAPTLRTPKGGGHQPFKLKKNGELSAITPEECELIMGFPIGWTDLNV